MICREIGMQQYMRHRWLTKHAQLFPNPAPPGFRHIMMRFRLFNAFTNEGIPFAGHFDRNRRLVKIPHPSAKPLNDVTLCGLR